MFVPVNCALGIIISSIGYVEFLVSSERQLDSTDVSNVVGRI